MAKMEWEAVLAFHEQAVADLAALAGRVPEERWREPLAEGKWTPAELVEHVAMAHDVLRREVEGGGGMKIRTKWWQRMLMRPIWIPRILRGAPFPRNIPAPRELVPVPPDTDPATAIADLRDRAARFAAAAARAQAGGSPPRLTHPYLGQAPLADAFLFNARHTRHHLAQLAARYGEGAAETP